MKEYLVVDGYNIINAWQELKAISTRDLEGARDKLIEIMLEYSAFSDVEVIIVFDAYRVKGGSEVEIKHPKVTVVYTKENQTADSYIEKVIGELGRYSLISVATNDGAQQQVVLGRGSARLTARELEIRIQNSKNSIKKRTKAAVAKTTLADRLREIDEEAFLKLESMRKKG